MPRKQVANVDLSSVEGRELLDNTLTLLYRQHCSTIEQDRVFSVAGFAALTAVTYRRGGKDHTSL